MKRLVEFQFVLPLILLLALGLIIGSVHGLAASVYSMGDNDENARLYFNLSTPGNYVGTELHNPSAPAFNNPQNPPQH
jgi:hypothetical protein